MESKRNGSTKRKAPTHVASVPDGFLTTRVAAPATPAGVRNATEVPSIATLSTNAGMPLKRASSPCSNPVPVSVTSVPPDEGP
jgi:hypothetical protein